VLPQIGTTRVRLAFDLGLDAYETAPEVDLVRLWWEPPPSGCTGLAMIFVKRAATNLLALQETYVGCGGVIYHPFAAPLDSQLHHYELIVDYGTDRLAVRRDGVDVLSISATRDLAAAAHQLDLGVPSTVSGTTAEWRIRYDNVVVDLE
jgi:hypothetical protein